MTDTSHFVEERLREDSATLIRSAHIRMSQEQLVRGLLMREAAEAIAALRRERDLLAEALRDGHEYNPEVGCAVCDLAAAAPLQEQEQ